MEQDKREVLFNLMLDKGIDHFKKEVPVMHLTAEGYVDSGKTEPVWKAADVTAFTALLKLADYKHIDGLSEGVEGMRGELANKRAKREAARKALPNLRVV